MKTSVGMMQWAVLVLAICVTAGVVWAAAEEASAFRYGADLRLREEYLDKIPIRVDPPGVTRGGKNNYFRIRPRLWMELDPMENVTLRARVTNEFRVWDINGTPFAGSLQRGTYNFPDEWVFDHLYLDVRNLIGNKLDLRIGRQDLIYGTGKLILEGTPKDGSRTIYFNAIKAAWKATPKTTIDVFGTYNESIDPIAINDADRDLTGQTKANDDITESGGGVYLKDKSIANLPLEAYYIYKNENDPRPGPAVKVHTAGFRLMPRISEALKGNLEFAYQTGERGADVDIAALGLDASLNYKLPVAEQLKPAFDLGFYYLTGDDPATADVDESWNPIWARYPQYSELYVYSWDADAAGRWQNAMMPYGQLVFNPFAKHKVTAMAGYLMAPEKNGPGGGDVRGLLGVLKDEFSVAEKLLTSKDKLTAHLWAEVLKPGNYYKVDETACFLRWELMYAF